MEPAILLPKLKLLYIDAIRGIAILGVIMVHVGQHGNTLFPRAVDLIIKNGARGVQLFFLTSAFTLFLSYRQNRWATDFSDFFIRRIFRIAPVYYLGLAYYLLQSVGFADKLAVYTPAQVISNVLFLHGLSPYWIKSIVPGGWSIATEMMFYACVPFLVTRITSLNRAAWLFIGAILFRFGLQYVVSVSFPLVDPWLMKDFLFMYLPGQLPVFALGIMGYFIVIEQERHLPFVTGATFCMLVAGKLLVRNLMPGFVLISMVFIGLLLGLSRLRETAFSPVLLYIGRISYSLYIVHFAILFWLDQVDLANPLPHSGALLNFTLRFALVLSFSILIATVLYRTVEVPMQRVGKSLVKARQKALYLSQSFRLAQVQCLSEKRQN